MSPKPIMVRNSLGTEASTEPGARIVPPTMRNACTHTSGTSASSRGSLSSRGATYHQAATAYAARKNVNWMLKSTIGSIDVNDGPVRIDARPGCASRCRHVLTRTRRRLLLAILGTAVIVLSFPSAASAHYERPTTAPDGTGHVPELRKTGPELLVCNDDSADFKRRIVGFDPNLQEFNRDLYAQCIRDGYRHLQAAV